MTETIEPMPTSLDQQRLAQELVDKARADGVELVGPGGLLTGLTKSVLETALEAEVSEHLGYDKHDSAGRDGGNSRNGTRSKTVLTEIGPVEIDVPRDRDGTFDPVIVRKRQRRLTGVNGIVLSLSARGLTTGEIAAHFAEVYGASISKDTTAARSAREDTSRPRSQPSNASTSSPGPSTPQDAARPDGRSPSKAVSSPAAPTNQTTSYTGNLTVPGPGRDHQRGDELGERRDHHQHGNMTAVPSPSGILGSGNHRSHCT
jgi:hypothetical protein